MSIPDPASSGKPLLVCYSHLRWDWVYQRPQHLLSRLSRLWPVVMVEEPWIDDRPPGLDLLAVAPNLTVVRPHRPSGSGHDLDALVEGYVGTVRGGRPLIRWFYSPMFAGYGDRLAAGQAVVFDCMDELANFAGAPAGLREFEARLMARADVVFTGGRSLHEKRRDRHSNVHCFPSAVDSAHFARALRPDLPLPDDLACLPRPILGYYGVVDERLDYGLIADLAEAHQGGSVVLVGPMIKVDPAALPRRANLHYLGQRSYADLPAYLKGFDACLMPWALNDATRHISPTKTLEYMAGGKPIVSTAVLDVVRDHGDLVFVADSPAEFIELARSAPDRHDAARASAERARAAQQSWDAVAEAMVGLITPHLPRVARRPERARPGRVGNARRRAVGGGTA